MNAASILADADIAAADVLVLGGGPAGAWAAIAAAEAGARVILADKGRMGTSGATAAANTAVIHVAPGSAGRRQVVERRLGKGGGLVDAASLDHCLNAAWHAIPRLAEWGYAFPRDETGATYRGTLRGPDYMQVLRRRLHKLRVRILDHSPAVALLSDGEGAAGAWGFSRRTSVAWTVRAGAVVVATGGCAFRSKALGTHGLTGDGLLMAAELGADLSGMEFAGQYGISHAAATVTKNLIYNWATFSDAAGTILDGSDPFEILARHLPAGPVHAVIDKASPDVQEGLRRGQPNILLALDRQGIDPFKARFPVTLRYEGTVRGVGGLRTDAAGATSVPGLFAAGDAASREAVVGAVSGGGGPNATWAIVSGAEAGRAAAATAHRRGSEAAASPIAAPGADIQALSDDEMREAVGIVQDQLFPIGRSYRRDAPSIAAASARLGDIRQRLHRDRRSSRAPADVLRTRELEAMVAAGRWIFAAAAARTETRGIHRRSDFGAADPAQARPLIVSGLDAITVRAAGLPA
jgi:succinate dehydrogenase/fumarate reductase flavoprotein subunit